MERPRIRLLAKISRGGVYQCEDTLNIYLFGIKYGGVIILDLGEGVDNQDGSITLTNSVLREDIVQTLTSGENNEEVIIRMILDGSNASMRLDSLLDNNTFKLFGHYCFSDNRGHCRIDIDIPSRTITKFTYRELR